MANIMDLEPKWLWNGFPFFVFLYLKKKSAEWAHGELDPFFLFVFRRAGWSIFSFVKASAPSLQAMHGSYLLTTYRLLNRNELLKIYPFPLFSEDVRTGLGNIGMVLTIRDGLLGISTEATSGKITNVSLQKCPCIGLNIGHLLVIEHDSNTEKKT